AENSRQRQRNHYLRQPSRLTSPDAESHEKAPRPAMAKYGPDGQVSGPVSLRQKCRVTNGLPQKQSKRAGMVPAKVTPLIRLHVGPSVPCQRDWHTGTVILLPRKTVI